MEQYERRALQTIILTWGPVLLIMGLIMGLWLFFMRAFRSRSQYPLRIPPAQLEIMERAAAREGLTVESWLTRHGTDLAKEQLGEE